MQVSNSPSRKEVNIQHSRGSWLDIGVPSVHNTFRVSRFKTLSWMSLLLSSIPVHILFNSTIFATNHKGSDFHLVIGTEALLNGGPYYPPGASIELVDWYKFTFKDTSSVNDGYGEYRNLSRNIPEFAGYVRNASHWDRLEINQCNAGRSMSHVVVWSITRMSS